MNTDRVNQWLTLGANVGVLAGIVFLALEIRQNSELARLQFSEDQQALWQEGEMMVFGDSIAAVWAKSVIEPESLTLAELRMLDAYLAFQLSIPSRVLQLEQAGLLDAGTTEESVKSAIPFFFDSEFAKAWWEVEGRTWSSDLVELADPVVQGVPTNQTVNKLLKIQSEAVSRTNDSK